MSASPAARILIVDDEPALTKSLCDTLATEGYETVGCTSGQAAIEALGSTNFDLLLTDLWMPEMDGITLCQAAQKFDSNLVSIVMTGASTVTSAVKAMKAGALDYITKPLVLGVILAVLSRSLDVRRLRLENAELARLVAERTADLETANQALRKSENHLRALANWIVQAQEHERHDLAFTLHDNVTQLLCAIQIHTQALLARLPPGGGRAKREATRLCEMVGNAAEEVESISRRMRPSVLKELGLVAVMHTTTEEFAKRTGVPIKLTCVPFRERLHAETELTLYRILQECLQNVEQHARAHQVTVRLTKPKAVVQLVVHDDGVGFDPGHPASEGKEKSGLGLLSMRERATFLGGTLTVKSVRSGGRAKAGTAIEVRLPLRS